MWTCPDVTPYSDIYFYEFSHDGALDPTWTTRFIITNSTSDEVGISRTLGQCANND